MKWLCSIIAEEQLSESLSHIFINTMVFKRFKICDPVTSLSWDTSWLIDRILGMETKILHLWLKGSIVLWINLATRTIFRGSSCQTANWFLRNDKTWRFHIDAVCIILGSNSIFARSNLWCVRIMKYCYGMLRSIPTIQREITWFWSPGIVGCHYFQIRTCSVLKIELQTT